MPIDNTVNLAFFFLLLFPNTKRNQQINKFIEQFTAPLQLLDMSQSYNYEYDNKCGEFIASQLDADYYVLLH